MFIFFILIFVFFVFLFFLLFNYFDANKSKYLLLHSYRNSEGKNKINDNSGRARANCVYSKKKKKKLNGNRRGKWIKWIFM